MKKYAFGLIDRLDELNNHLPLHEWQIEHFEIVPEIRQVDRVVEHVSDQRRIGRIDFVFDHEVTSEILYESRTGQYVLVV